MSKGKTVDIKDLSVGQLNKMLLVLGAIGAVFCVVFIINCINYITYEKVDATVTSVTSLRPTYKSKPEYYAEYKYEFEGNFYTAKERMFSNKYSEGEVVKIRINPNNPEELLHDFYTLLSGGVMLVLIVVSIPIIKQKKYKVNILKMR